MNDKGINLEGLGEERLQLIREAAEASKGKVGMEKIDVFLTYAERLSAGEPLPKAEQQALLAAVAATLPDEERTQLIQVITMMGLG